MTTFGVTVPFPPENLPDHGGGPIRVGTGIIVRSGSGMPPHGRPEVVTRSPLAVVPENEPGMRWPSLAKTHVFTPNGLRRRREDSMLGSFGEALPQNGQLVYLDLGPVWALGRVLVLQGVSGLDVSAEIFATGDSKAISGTGRKWFVPPLKRTYETLMWKRRPTLSERRLIMYHHYTPETGELSGGATSMLSPLARVLVLGAMSGAVIGGTIGAVYAQRDHGKALAKGAAVGAFASLVLHGTGLLALKTVGAAAAGASL